MSVNSLSSKRALVATVSRQRSHRSCFPHLMLSLAAVSLDRGNAACLPWAQHWAQRVLGGVASFHGQPVEAPFEHPVVQPPGRMTGGVQKVHCFVGEHAVCSPAVRDDFPVGREFAQAGREFIERDRHGAGNVSGAVFLRWADIEHGDGSRPGLFQEFLPGHFRRFPRSVQRFVARDAEVFGAFLFDVGDPGTGNAAHQAVKAATSGPARS